MSKSTLGAVLLVLALAGCDTVATLRFMFANDGTETRWDSEANSIELPIELHPHVLVPVHVNDSEPFAFVLDTGAPVTGLIGNSRTERLQLPLGRRLAMGGSGSGATP